MIVQKDGENMGLPKIYEKEYQLCLILWEHEPVTVSEMSVLCGEQLKWAKTTTYTVIKRLCDKGVLKNEYSVVTSLFTKEQIQDYRTEELLKKTFGGQLADLIASISRLVSKFWTIMVV